MVIARTMIWFIIVFLVMALLLAAMPKDAGAYVLLV